MTQRFHIEDLVADFNEQITKYDPTNGYDSKLIELRGKQMHEEVDEILEALENSDRIGAVDGLLDLIYFSLGTLHIMGVERELMNACFQAIHLANMGKNPGIKESRRIEGVPDHLHPMDAIKPNGWIPPEFVLKVLLDE